MISMSVTVSGPVRDVHSGNDGGVFVEPMMDLLHVCASLMEPGSTQIKVRRPSHDLFVVLVVLVVLNFYQVVPVECLCEWQQERPQSGNQVPPTTDPHSTLTASSFHHPTPSPHCTLRFAPQIPGFYEHVAPGLIDLAWSSLAQHGGDEFSLEGYRSALGVPELAPHTADTR